MRMFFFFFIGSINFGIAQSVSVPVDESKPSIALSLSAERNDFYTTFTYIKSIRSFSVNPSLGFGLIHSVFQSNPFIRTGVDVYYNPLKKSVSKARKIIMGIGTGYYFSFYNRPSFTNHHELCAGYLFQIGRRFKFFQKTFIGLLRESFMGNSARVYLIYPNFHFSMGLSYEI